MRTLAGIGSMLVAFGAGAAAQEPRLQERLPDAVRLEVEAVLDSARVAGLPTEPLVDRALEGATKRAPDDRIVTAVRRLAGELGAARAALGAAASPAEIVAGAIALRAGARPDDLQRLRVLHTNRSVAVAAAVLADLVATGVPPDTATAAVLALAGRANDAEYVTFRRNVERDVALGASAVAALGVRLATAADQAIPEATRPRRKP